jgi:hypothetical protein
MLPAASMSMLSARDSRALLEELGYDPARIEDLEARGRQGLGFPSLSICQENYRSSPTALNPAARSSASEPEPAA